MSQRKNDAMRKRVDDLIACGYSLTGRDPVRLERGRSVKVIRGKVIIDL